MLQQKFFRLQIVPILRYKDTAALYPPNEINMSIGDFSSLVDRLPDAKVLIKRASDYELHYRNPKLRFYLKCRDNRFANCYNYINEHPNRKISIWRQRSDLETTFPAFLFHQKFELHVRKFILTEFVFLNHREIHRLFKNQFYVANKCEIFENN